MNRIIKFKAKVKYGPNEGKWIIAEIGESSIGQSMSDIYFNNTEVKKDTLCEFTGKKDKNDKDIYEGDLISFGDEYWSDDGMPDIKEIVFDEDSASFRIYDYLELQGSSLAEKWFMDDMLDDELEVIGNIHDNPELLK